MYVRCTYIYTLLLASTRTCHSNSPLILHNSIKFYYVYVHIHICNNILSYYLHITTAIKSKSTVVVVFVVVYAISKCGNKTSVHDAGQQYCMQQQHQQHWSIQCPTHKCLLLSCTRAWCKRLYGNSRTHLLSWIEWIFFLSSRLRMRVCSVYMSEQHSDNCTLW